MKSAVIKRSLFINGHKTSVSLENDFWDGLREIAADERTSVPTQVERIDRRRNTINLSSAIRMYVFKCFRDRIGRRNFRMVTRRKRPRSPAVKRRGLKASAYKHASESR